MITLFQHQQQALDETEGKNRVAYYLDMGLGKTFVGSEKALKLNSRVNLLVNSLRSSAFISRMASRISLPEIFVAAGFSFCRGWGAAGVRFWE